MIPLGRQSVVFEYETRKREGETIREMRNYQTLTVIGGIITILIALAIWVLFAGLNTVHQSFGNYTNKYGTSQQIQQYNQGRQMFSSGLSIFQVAIPVAVFLNVIAMIAVFIFKDRFKLVGILLITIGVITAIAISAYGIVALGMFIAAGIIALRYKPHQAAQSIY